MFNQQGVSAFDDVLTANRERPHEFAHADLTGRAARGLAVVTCMDSRIDPLGLLGLKAGDAKILRNAGARVTDDVQRTLVLAVYVLGVNRVLVMPHTDCGMTKVTDSDVHDLTAKRGVDTRSLEFHTVPDQVAALRRDLLRMRASPFLPADLPIGGAIYDVRTGVVIPVEP
ncbi:carbonic anhydrase [Spongiactinospora sp. TRM90649]|uniref:beta-class carbonic anhydrase n=1 Tax=Spongiactinospora sp. TRM90649 TaxID=3031114 RepID=UPI0023F6577E|nr:carbonic anhydrase [Spongiactinospora sp. TRM90649]MDF5754189.1 carbonic anhydrase [Spongiactinospora sp. TRM90649]